MATGAGVLDPIDLEGRTILVQGASGTVGDHVLTELLERGAHVAVATHRAWQVEPLRNRLGTSTKALVAHVATGDGEAAAGLVKGATDALGPIVGFVSAAGAFDAAPAARVPVDLDRDLMAANFFAVHGLARAVVPPMIRRNTGRVVVIGARIVGAAIPGLGAYAASKAALHEWATCLANEVREHGVGVAVVAPGMIDTPANRNAQPEADPSDWLPPESVARALVEALAGPFGADPVVRPLPA